MIKVWLFGDFLSWKIEVLRSFSANAGWLDKPKRELTAYSIRLKELPSKKATRNKKQGVQKSSFSSKTTIPDSFSLHER